MAEPLVRLEDKDKLELLKVLLLENNKQLVSWRERNWIALRDTVGGLIAIAGISRFASGAERALVIAALTLAAFATVYLTKNFKRYQELRNHSARLEEALSLYVKGAFLPLEGLMPESYRFPKADWRGSYIFIAAIWLVTAAISWGPLSAR